MRTLVRPVAGPARSVSVRSSIAMAGAAALLVMGVVGGAGVSLWQSRQAAWHSAAQSGRNLAHSLERDISRNVEFVDHSLLGAARGLELLEGAALTPAAERALLFDGALGAGSIGAMLVVDAAGTVLRDSGSAQPRVWNVADSAAFRTHRDRPAEGLLVTTTQQDLIDNGPGLVLSRRLSQPDGTFAGIVSAGIALDYVRKAFEAVSLGRGGAITLFGTDGRIVLAHPDADAAGRDISASPHVRAFLQSGAQSATYDSPAVVDGVVRLFTVQRVGSLPLVVAVGQPLAEVYADWTMQACTTAGGLLLFTALSVGLLLVLRRELRRRRGAELASKDEARAARAAEAKLRAYFKHLADGVLAIRVEPDGRFLYERINAAAQDMLGTPADRAVGREPNEVWPEAQAREIEARLREAASASGPTRYEQVRETPQGRRVLRVVLAAVREHEDDALSGAGAGADCGAGAAIGQGRVVLLLGSVRDVSREAALDAQLLQAQRMEAVGQLTAGIAHDFNNLLQAQMGGLELLLDEVRGQPRAEEYVAMALSAGERGARLTHSLLAFSRQQVLRPEAVDLPGLLSGLETILSRTLDPRITLRVDTEAGLPLLLADPAQVEAAALNLCLNARDAMQGGGRLLVEAYDGRNALEVPPGIRPGSYLVLAVEDEGCGMQPDVAAQACEPFFTTKGIGEGSGLGLSMVQGFARQSGGELRILSHPGHGTRVEIWLPKVAAELAPQPVPPGAARAQGRGRVLLVDDAPEVLLLLGDMLAGAGYEVAKAANGEDALVLLSAPQGRAGTEGHADGVSGYGAEAARSDASDATTFDVLVTDYAMPGMTGGELLAHAAVRHPRLPALVITGYADAADLKEVPAHVRVVHKPFRGDVLLRHVRDLVSASASAETVARAWTDARPEMLIEET